MRKVKIFVVFLSLFVLSPIACLQASSSQVEKQESANYGNAKEEYRLYLQELKRLNAQYQQVTGEIAKVIKEEGMPTWEESDAVQELAESQAHDAEGVRIEESTNEMIVSIDMPGIKKESAQINIADTQILKVTAKRKNDETKLIQKTIKLPYPANKSGASAKYEDGVLIVKIYKSKEDSSNIPILIQ